MNCGFWTYDGKFLIAAPQEWGNIGDELIFGFDKTGDGQVDYEETFYIGDFEADKQTPNQQKGIPQLNFLVRKPDKNENGPRIITTVNQIREYLNQFPSYGEPILSVNNTGNNILTGKERRKIYSRL